MSEIKQAAELEAAIAEADLTDEEGERVTAILAEGVPVEDAIATVLSERELEETGDTAAAPAEPPSGEPSKKQLKQLDAEQARHENRVREIMGAFVEGFAPCEACAGVGLVPPGPPPPEPQGHEFFKACPTCVGFGLVKTGSLRPGNESRDCPECKGRGYLEALNAAGQPLAPEQGAPPPPPPPTTGEESANGAQGANGVHSFGTPSWMGDPSLSRT